MTISNWVSPHYSYGDLVIGGSGAPGGSDGYCDQGGTYRGTDGEICGGDGNWGATDVEVWYPRPPPPQPPPPPDPAAFRPSRLITPQWGGQLSVWAGTEGQEWALCCSTFEGCDTAAKFHAACDAHTPTLTVAHNAGGTTPSGLPHEGEINPGNFTFGGFVRIPSTRLRAAILVVAFWPFLAHLSPAFLPRSLAVGSGLGLVGTASARR